MSSDLERLLGGSSAEAEERALRRALGALPGRERRLWPLLAAAAVVALLGAAAGALAVAQRTHAPAKVHVQANARGIAAVSPHALYVAAGLGDALVAMAPDGTRAWSHATRGPVAAIAWAPSGLRIAYVVHVGARFELRLIEGDGDHDGLVDASVRPARPAWSGDSLAVTYVGAGGARTRYDLAHRTHRVLR